MGRASSHRLATGRIVPRKQTAGMLDDVDEGVCLETIGALTRLQNRKIGPHRH